MMHLAYCFAAERMKHRKDELVETDPALILYRNIDGDVCILCYLNRKSASYTFTAHLLTIH